MGVESKCMNQCPKTLPQQKQTVQIIKHAAESTDLCTRSVCTLEELFLGCKQDFQTSVVRAQLVNQTRHGQHKVQFRNRAHKTGDTLGPSHTNAQKAAALAPSHPD